MSTSFYLLQWKTELESGTAMSLQPTKGGIKKSDEVVYVEALWMVLKRPFYPFQNQQSEIRPL